MPGRSLVVGWYGTVFFVRHSIILSYVEYFFADDEVLSLVVFIEYDPGDGLTIIVAEDDGFADVTNGGCARIIYLGG